jgi:hypothetical protein
MMAVGPSIFGILSWFVMMSGFMLPLGVPPLPEDPALAKVAPAECLFYSSSSGMAAPDASSANQTEQLLAEPEVQQIAAGVEKALQSAMEKSMSRGGDPPFTAEEFTSWIKIMLTRPWAVYVADITPPGPGGREPEVRAGMIVHVGDQTAPAEKLLDLLMKQAQAVPLDQDGVTWLQIQLPGEKTKLVLGLKEKYFIAAIGNGELEKILGRLKGEPPQWLATLRKELPVERVSGVTYVNVEKILRTFLPMAGGPDAVRAAAAFGVSNLTHLAGVSGLDQSGFVSRTQLNWKGEPQGLLKLLDVQPLTADDLKAIPRDPTLAVAVKLDLQKVFDTFVDVLGTVEPRAKEEFLKDIREADEASGIPFREEILKPLGDTFRVYDSPSEGGLLAGATAVVSLKDAKAAAATHDKLLTALQGALQEAEHAIQQEKGDFLGFRRRSAPRIEKLPFLGNTIYLFSPGEPDAPVAPSWCLTDKELIVALYPQGVKAYLARGKEFSSLAEAPEVEKALQSDSGLVSLAYLDTQRVFDWAYPFAPALVQSMSVQFQRMGLDMNLTGLVPSAGAIRRHLRPGLVTLRRTASGIEIVSRQTLPGGGMFSAMPLVMPGLWFSRMSMSVPARSTARKVASTNNMRQISLAMLNYENVYGKFPPAYKADKDGKPLLSWRVLILPYLEQQSLYQQFHLDEPWDSEHNKKLIDRMPVIYQTPGSAAGRGKATYLTVRGPKTVFPGKEVIRMAEIRDGTSNTIMTVEVPDNRAVVWTKPDDFKYDEKNPINGLLGRWPGGFNAGFADSSVRFLNLGISPSTLKAYFTRNGGEAVQNEGE